MLGNHLTSHNEVLDHYKKLHSADRSLPPNDGEIQWIIDRHGFWLLWHDEARNVFLFPDGLVDPEMPIVFGDTFTPDASDPKWTRYKQLVVNERGYALASGAGSVGLGVRLDTGVCLRDTIRDTRGAVAFEDILSCNYSFIGVPIYRNVPGTFEPGRNADRRATLGATGKPFVYFCLLYPQRGAWHPDEMSCCHATGGNSQNCVCLYERIEAFCENTVKPVVELAYEMLQLRDAQAKMAHIADLGNGTETGREFRRNVLSIFITPKVDSSSPGKKVKRDLLGFRTAALHEVASSASGDWEEVLKKDNLADLYSSFIEGMGTDEQGLEAECKKIGGTIQRVPLDALNARLILAIAVGGNGTLNAFCDRQSASFALRHSRGKKAGLAHEDH